VQSIPLFGRQRNPEPHWKFCIFVLGKQRSHAAVCFLGSDPGQRQSELSQTQLLNRDRREEKKRIGRVNYGCCRLQDNIVKDGMCNITVLSL